MERSKRSVSRRLQLIRAAERHLQTSIDCLRAIDGSAFLPEILILQDKADLLAVMGAAVNVLAAAPAARRSTPIRKK